MRAIITLLLVFLSLPLVARPKAKTPQPNPMGTLYASERTTYNDPVTGLMIECLTDTTCHDSYIYQTDPMWTPDQRFLLFRSSTRASRHVPDQRPQGQFFIMEVATGEMMQLTDGEHGSVFLANRSNHIFINRMDPVLDARRRPTGERRWSLYRMDIDQLWADAHAGKVGTREQYETFLGSMVANDTIYGIPGSYCVSSEDDYAYIVMSRKAADPSEYEEMKRWAMEPRDNQPIKIKPSLGGICRMNLRTGEVDKVIDTYFKVGHIQASRFHNDEILFCNETGGDAKQRIWYVKADGTDFRAIYNETPLDWVTHETFGTEDYVYFNILGFQDRLRKQASGIMRINLRNDDVECVGQVELEGSPYNDNPALGGRGFWHCNSSRDNRWATGDTFAGNVWIIDVATGLRTLIATDCRMTPDHAQPHFSPDGRYLLFQSGHFTDGKRLNLMLVDLAQLIHR